MLASLLLGVAVFLVLRCVRGLLLIVSLFGQAGSFGEGPGDMSPVRLCALAALPFGFNLSFGFFFGSRFLKARASRRERRAIGLRHRSPINPWLGGLLLWWLLFNMPVFLFGDPSGRWLLPSWPPEAWYLPIRQELSLFFPMGNRALVAGFIGAIAWGRLGPRLATRRQRG